VHLLVKKNSDYRFAMPLFLLSFLVRTLFVHIVSIPY